MLAPKYYKQDLENSVLGRIINHDITKVNVIDVWKKYFFMGMGCINPHEGYHCFPISCGNPVEIVHSINS